MWGTHPPPGGGEVCRGFVASLSASQVAWRKRKGPSPRSLAKAEGEADTSFREAEAKSEGSRQLQAVDAITQSHPLAPPELAGKWIAWSGNNREIVAYGDTLAEVRDQVAHMRGGEVSYEKLRPLSRSLASQG